jgi:pimeloyl-ACP methyl ester carboxylesterase
MFRLWPSPSRPNAAAIDRRGRRLRVVGEAGHVEVDGVKLAYWRRGQHKRTLVLVHGNSALKEAFHLQFAQLPAESFSLLAIDLPGHGASDDSPAPDRHYTISGYARLLGAALARLGVVEPVLLGWSLGGNIALEVAGNGVPMQALILAGAPPIGPGPRDFEAAFLAHPAGAVMGKVDATGEEMAAFVGAAYPTDAAAKDLFLAAALRTDGRARENMFKHWLSGREGCDQRETARTWSAPICVIHGERDPFVSQAYVEAAPWRGLWRKQINVIEASGHAPFLDQPAAFNALVLDFLSELAA